MATHLLLEFLPNKYSVTPYIFFYHIAQFSKHEVYNNRITTYIGLDCSTREKNCFLKFFLPLSPPKSSKLPLTQNLSFALPVLSLSKYGLRAPVNYLFLFSFFNFRFSFGVSWAFFCFSLLPLSFFPLSTIPVSPCLKITCIS